MTNTERERTMHTVRTIAKMHQEEPDAVCDTDALATRLGWPREEVQRRLFDARIAGYIVGQVARRAYVDLTGIKLKPAGYAALRRLTFDDVDVR